MSLCVNKLNCFFSSLSCIQSSSFLLKTFLYIVYSVPTILLTKLVQSWKYILKQIQSFFSTKFAFRVIWILATFIWFFIRLRIFFIRNKSKLFFFYLFFLLSYIFILLNWFKNVFESSYSSALTNCIPFLRVHFTYFNFDISLWLS